MAEAASISAAFLVHARRLTRSADDAQDSYWARAASVLGRIAIERATATILTIRAPGAEDAAMRVQLLCLEATSPDTAMARDAAIAWNALSRACHHHPYELAPGLVELVDHLDVAEALVREEMRLAGSAAS
jgi:hypothetical protein